MGEKNVKGGGYVLKKKYIGYISIKKVKVVSKLSIAIVTQVWNGRHDVVKDKT